MAIAPYEPTREAAGFLAEVRTALQDFAQRFGDEALLLSTRELAEAVAAVEELSKTVEQLQITGAHAWIGRTLRPWARTIGASRGRNRPGIPGTAGAPTAGTPPSSCAGG